MVLAPDHDEVAVFAEGNVVGVSGIEMDVLTTNSGKKTGSWQADAARASDARIASLKSSFTDCSSA